MASANGFIDIVKVLLDKGIDINIQNATKSTALRKLHQ